jgi:hypothetical protein
VKKERKRLGLGLFVLGDEHVFRVGHLYGRMAPGYQDRGRAFALNQAIERDVSPSMHTSYSTGCQTARWEEL